MASIPPNYTIERVTPLDSAWIQEMVNPFTEEQFGKTDIIRLTEHATTALSVHVNGVPVAFAAFSDQPLSSNWPNSENSTSWENYLQNNSDLGDIFQPWNTLWLQYFVARNHDNEVYFHAFLTYIFANQPQIHSILSGIKQKLSSILPAGIFSKIMEKDIFSIYAARREHIFPAMYVRPAVIED